MKKIPIKKNDQIELTITDLSHQGLGVGHIDGFPIFVENALPGEEVELKISHVGRRKAHGFSVNI